MALTVGNLFKESVKYNMKLLAGGALPACAADPYYRNK